MNMAYRLGLISEREWLILRTHIDLLGFPDPEQSQKCMTAQERQGAFNLDQNSSSGNNKERGFNYVNRSRTTQWQQ